jgi:hypothetical protein
MTHKDYNIPILGPKVRVLFDKTHQEASASMRKFLKEDYDCSEAVACVAREGSKIGLWLSPKAKVETVAHECYHILKETYEYAGCKVGADEEMDACFLEFITKKTYQIWEKKRFVRD